MREALTILCLIEDNKDRVALELQLCNSSFMPYPTRITGGFAWEVLHSVAALVQALYQKRPGRASVYENLFDCIVKRICGSFPCIICRRDSRRIYYNLGPPRLVKKEGEEGVDDAIDWMYTFHREVNRKLGAQHVQRVCEEVGGQGEVCQIMAGQERGSDAPTAGVTMKEFQGKMALQRALGSLLPSPTSLWTLLCLIIMDADRLRSEILVSLLKCLTTLFEEVVSFLPDVAGALGPTMVDSLHRTNKALARVPYHSSWEVEHQALVQALLEQALVAVRGSTSEEVVAKLQGVLKSLQL